LYGLSEVKQNGYGYRSEYHEGNLQYLRARYYDTESGRFMSKDSYLGQQGSSVTQNRYVYVLNNPMKYIDKDGHRATVGGLTGRVPNHGTIVYDSGSIKESGLTTRSWIASVNETVKQKAHEAVLNQTAKDVQEEIERIKKWYGDETELQQAIATVIAKYCVDRGLNPMEVLELEEVKSTVEKYTVVDQGFVNHFNTAYGERAQQNYQKAVSDFQNQAYDYIVEQMKVYKQYDKNADHCSQSYIDQVMEEYASSGSQLSPMEYYAQQVKKDKGIDVSVDRRNWAEKSLDTAITFVKDIGTVVVNGIQAIIDDPVQFVIDLVTAPVSMALNGIESIGQSLGEFGKVIEDISRGDWGSAGKHLLSGATDLVGGLASLGLAASMVLIAINPAAAFTIAGYALIGGALEATGGLAQNVVGQLTNDYGYELDGAGHVVLGLLKVLGAQRVQTEAGAVQGITDSQSSGDVIKTETASPYDLEPTHGLTDSKSEITKLTNEIKIDGITETVKYVEYNGKLYIVDGHHRVYIAKRLGLTVIPVEQVQLPYLGYTTFDDLIWYGD